nr:E3 ubiquitin-protein ligase UPL3 [Ipomoea batatas]GME01523.1 E3 ubiquitin-protein ligase UPL3 [Ipomoea batatas]
MKRENRTGSSCDVRKGFRVFSDDGVRDLNGEPEARRHGDVVVADGGPGSERVGMLRRASIATRSRVPTRSYAANHSQDSIVAFTPMNSTNESSGSATHSRRGRNPSHTFD